MGPVLPTGAAISVRACCGAAGHQKIHENSCDQMGRLRGIVPYSDVVDGLKAVRSLRTSVERGG